MGEQRSQHDNIKVFTTEELRLVLLLIDNHIANKIGWGMPPDDMEHSIRSKVQRGLFQEIMDRNESE